MLGAQLWWDRVGLGRGSVWALSPPILTFAPLLPLPTRRKKKKKKKESETKFHWWRRWKERERERESRRCLLLSSTVPLFSLAGEFADILEGERGGRKKRPKNDQFSGFCAQHQRTQFSSFYSNYWKTRFFLKKNSPAWNGLNAQRKGKKLGKSALIHGSICTKCDQRRVEKVPTKEAHFLELRESKTRGDVAHPFFLGKFEFENKSWDSRLGISKKRIASRSESVR